QSCSCTLEKTPSNKDVPLLIGPEGLLIESLAMGGNGGAPGGDNIFPELYVGLYENIQKGNLGKALNIHRKIMDVSSVINSGSVHRSDIVIAAIIKALSLQ